MNHRRNYRSGGLAAMRSCAQRTEIVYRSGARGIGANKRLVRPFDRHRRGAGAGSCLRCILLVKFNYIFGPSRRPLCTVMYPSRDWDEFFPASTISRMAFVCHRIFGWLSLLVFKKWNIFLRKHNVSYWISKQRIVLSKY